MKTVNVNKLFVVMIVLQSLTLLGLWTSSGTLPAAHAQVMDSGAQRQQIIAEQRQTNEKLDRLIGLLESGQVQVIVQTPDDDDDRAAK